MRSFLTAPMMTPILASTLEVLIIVEHIQLQDLAAICLSASHVD